MIRVVLLVGPAGRALPFALPLARGLGEVYALSLVPPDDREEGALRAASHAGAARAVAVWDPQLAATDYYAAAQTAAAAARKIGFDIIVCGDGNHGLLGPALADQLGVPHLTGVVAANLRGGRVVAHRAAGAGTITAFSAEPPLLLATPPPVFHHPLEVPPPDTVIVERMSLSDLGIAPAELRWRQRFAPRAAGKDEALSAPLVAPHLLSGPTELATRLHAEDLLARRGAREGGGGA